MQQLQRVTAVARPFCPASFSTLKQKTSISFHTRHDTKEDIIVSGVLRISSSSAHHPLLTIAADHPEEVSTPVRDAFSDPRRTKKWLSLIPEVVLL
jgi:hypothetical protein